MQTSNHNKRQIIYFEHNFKKGMIPAKSPYLERQIDFTVKIGRLKPEDKILEVGCGMGRYTLPLLKRNFNISGIDISGGLLDRLKQFNKQNYPVDLYCADIADASEKIGRKFDAVIGYFTLHHMRDLKSVFSGIHKVLKDRGRMIFLEPNPLNPLYYFQIFFTPNMKWSMEKGMLRLKKNAVFALLEESGFSNLSHYCFGFFPPFLVNTGIGMSLEKKLEKVPFLYSILPFQVFMAEKNGL